MSAVVVRFADSVCLQVWVGLKICVQLVIDFFMTKYILLFLLFCASVIHAEELPVELDKSEANLYGRVVDARTGEALSFITVSLKGTTIGVATDSEGNYVLGNLPEGEFVLLVKAVGYKPLEQKIVLKKGRTEELVFKLEEDLVALDEVVVSANRNETTRRMAPTIVKVLDEKMFEARSAACLADGLSFQPGVRVENSCQNCGSAQVRINGLDGPYTQLLIDSRPVFSALSGVYGLEQIPANMIERVEVMRGGGSALFGSSAIAGTINIITKEPQYNAAYVSHDLLVMGGKAFDNVTSLNASLVSKNHAAGMYLFGQSRFREGYDHDGDSFTELPKINAKTLGMRTFLKTGMYSRLTAEYHTIREFRRGGDSLDLQPHQALIAEQLDHNIHTGSVKFDYFAPNERHRMSVFSSLQHIDRASYYGTGRNPNAYGGTDNLTTVSGIQYSGSFGHFLFMPSEVTAGVEYSYDYLHDVIKGYDRNFSQTTHVVSAFLQNEWKNDRWGILLGGRLDKHSMLENPVFSPRVNVRFNPSESVNLRASYSAGFRAPQAYDEDLHIDMVGEGRLATIRNADGLKKERSNSFSLSGDFYRSFGKVQVNLLVEGFYTSLKDVFAVRDLHQEGALMIRERYNGSGAKVMGVNLEGRGVFTRWFELQAGATFQRSRYDEPEAWSEDETVPAEKRMFRTPDFYGYFTGILKPAPRWSAWLSGTYTGEMLVQHMAGVIAKDMAVETPGFFDMELKTAYDFRLGSDVTLQVNAGIKNIFNAYQDDMDKGPDRDPGYLYGPSLPRSYFCGVKLSF